MRIYKDKEDLLKALITLREAKVIDEFTEKLVFKNIKELFK